MKVYYNFDEIDFNPETVLTVGTFDGVHRGHQLIIERLKEISGEKGFRPVLLTIHPHPQIVLRKADKPPVKMLTDLPERLKLLEHFGVEHTLVVPFSYEFSQTPPDVFVKEFLHSRIGMKYMLIGYDHMFGKNREGNENLLQDLSSDLDFEIEKVPPFYDDGVIISSTRIRNAIKDKDIHLANEMLGYDYFIDGEVVTGDRRGATLGFPTANVAMATEHKLVPPNGIYLVGVNIKDKKYFGLANIGTRPTFTDDTEPTLEVYILDFKEDIYGAQISVSFLRYLREEKKFVKIDDLIEEMKNDEAKGRELIKKFYY